MRIFNDEHATENVKCILVQTCQTLMEEGDIVYVKNPLMEHYPEHEILTVVKRNGKIYIQDIAFTDHIFNETSWTEE